MRDASEPRHASTEHRSAAAVQRAQRLRSEPTQAERKLRAALRSRRFEAVKFRRQVPVDHYIADFCSFERRLVVEVDGGQHDERRGQDQVRTHYLESQNFRILRFWNNEVLNNLDGVLVMIEQALHAVPDKTPHPDPLPQGERGLRKKQ